MSGSLWRVAAPAKLTVSLEVTGVRPDGYHELRSEMVSLDLADELLIDPGGSGVRLEAGPGSRAEQLSSGPDNLVVRALRAVRRSAGVELRKLVPVGGGLGGGSSDAAAVLRWAGVTDAMVAASLGADVPFCVVGGRALVSGIGEQVAPLPHMPRTFVLLLPPFGVDTKSVYREWDRLSEGRGGPWHEPPNDLTGAALAVEPRLGRWRDLLYEATGRRPVLAGSGSTWFVEGTREGLGLGGAAGLGVGTDQGALLEVRTVPAEWGIPEAVPAGGSPGAIR